MATAADVPAVDDGEESVLRVKNTSDPQSVASALSHALYDGRRVTLRAIGAGSVNQAVKACAIARGFVAPRGIDLSVRPGFTTVDMPDGTSLSAITLTILADRA
jgi:stage V sporulation protein S